MMRWIIGSSLKFRLVVVAVASATLVVGVSQLRSAPVDVLPEFGPPTVEIQTEALGLSASEVEQLITVPMEQDLLVGIAFVEDIRSESVPGLSRILLVFEPGTDIYRARQVVAERLTQAHALPHVSKPPQMLQPLSSTNRVLMVGVSSQDVSAIQMSVLARWTIVPRLMGVPGVANVAIWGQRDRQLQVQVDPQRLRDNGVSLLQILETTGNALWVSPLTFVEASTPGTGGFIETPNQRLGVQHLSPISTAEDLAKIRLEGTAGRSLRLGDVASVVEDHQPLIGDAILDNGDGLLLVVEKFRGANTLDVTRGVEDAIAAMRPGMTGLKFDASVYRPASYVEKSVDNLALALVVAAALLLLLIGAAFFNWRTALVALIAIPMSLLTAGLVLTAFGESFNAMVVAGLVAALLLIVDDAIGDVDNIALRLRRARAEGGDRSNAAIILESALEVRGAAFYGTLIVALAIVPVFFLTGLPGAFFPSIAVAYLVALAASMAVALTVTPALSMLLFTRASVEPGGSPLGPRFKRGYEVALAQIVDKTRLAYLGLAALVVAGAASAPFLTQSLLPTLNETELLISWEGPAGTSLPEMNRITTLASRELRSIDGVRNVGAHVGRAVTADQAVGINSGEIWVSIDPAADHKATLAAVTSVVAGYPGLSRDVQTFSQQRVRDVLSGIDDDIVVRLYGEDLGILHTKAEEVRLALTDVEGLARERVQTQPVEPTLEIEADLAAAAKYGIKPGDIRRAAATLLSGITVGSLFEQQKVFDVVVNGTPATRNSLTAVQELLVDTPTGHARMGDVAHVRIAPNPAVVLREGVSRYVDVAASVQGRSIAGAAKDVERALQQIDFPLESHPAVLTAEGQPRGRLIAIGVAAAIGILLLLQAAFGSWRLAAVVLLILPVTVTGAAVAALADGGKLSFGSLIGVFAVFGLGARSAVRLIARYGWLERHEGQAFGRELIVRGAREQFSRTVMTAAAAALVLSPFAVAGPIAGQEILHPLAIVVLGGLVSATLVNLFVVPVLYLRFGAASERETSVSLARAPQTNS